MKKAIYIVGLLSTMSFVAGWFCSIVGYPPGRELSFYGFAAFAFVYLPMMVIDHFRSNNRLALPEKLKLIFGVSSAILIATAGIFKYFHLQGTTTILFMGAGLCIFGFVPFFFFSMYKKSIS